jgi:hypothetical protein
MASGFRVQDISNARTFNPCMQWPLTSVSAHHPADVVGKSYGPQKLSSESFVLDKGLYREWYGVAPRGVARFQAQQSADFVEKAGQNEMVVCTIPGRRDRRLHRVLAY